MKTIQKQSFWKSLGPGLLFASAAIGVSHLVQSTRAGANYGFALAWVILLANLFKYPFFEYGSRYAIATQTSIIDGYKRLGNWVLIGYFIVSVISMMLVTALVTFVTAGFCENLFGIELVGSQKLITPLVLLSICIVILLVGKYKVMDNLLKIVATVLLISTLAALIAAMYHGSAPKVEGFVAPEIWNEGGLLFIIALMGWMPTAVDLSSWNSLWTLEKIKTTGYKPSLKECLFEFDMGYFVSAILAFCFLAMGALLMYGTGTAFSNSSAVFAGQVVELYTSSIGSWSYLIIAAAAFSAMFSTSITVLDGYARALQRTTELTFPSFNGSQKVYGFWLIAAAVSSMVIISMFLGSLKLFADMVTTLSFIVAPLIAIANFRLVSAKYVGKAAVPSLAMRILSYLGIIFLTSFTIIAIYLFYYK